MCDAMLSTDANSEEISTALRYFSCWLSVRSLLHDFTTNKDDFSWEVENICGVDLS